MAIYDVIITAAGTGTRSNLQYNKVFVELADKPCILYSIERFLKDPEVAHIYITIKPSDEEQMQEMLGAYGLTDKPIFFVYGGNTRQESVLAALKLVKSPYVFVHDAARPFIHTEYIKQLKDALKFDDAAILAVPAVDTLKEITATKEVGRTIPRKRVAYAQTPQAFDTELLLKCHLKAEEESFTATDDAQLVEVYGGEQQVQVVLGSKMNFKITTQEDIFVAQLVAEKM